MKPLTKLAQQIVGTGTIPTLVRDAFRVAQEERPGPVLLELPEDIAGEECKARRRSCRRIRSSMPVAGAEALDRAAADDPAPPSGRW